MNVFLTSSTRTKLLAAWETALLLYTPLFSHQPLTHTSSPTHSPSHLLGSIDDTSVVPKLERSYGSNGNSIDKGCCDLLWKEKENLVNLVIHTFYTTQVSFQHKWQLQLTGAMCKCAKGREQAFIQQGWVPVTETPEREMQLYSWKKFCDWK